MKSTRLVIFENSTANFRLSVDTMLSKPRPDGSESDLVFIGKDNRTGTFRPSVFLVFTYLTDDYTTTQGVYTSYAHMYRIRSMFSAMHDILNSEDAFTTIEGALTPNSKYVKPLILDNIGKNNDWISLTLSRFKDPNSVQYYPAVALEISKSNGYSSLLSAAEFESIYDVIMHLDLVNMENQAVLLELITRAGISKPEEQTSAPQSNYNSYSGNKYQYRGNSDHRYGGNSYSYHSQNQAYNKPAPAADHPQTSYQTPVPQRHDEEQAKPVSPTVSAAPSAEAKQADPTITESQTPTNSPSKPKVSMAAVSQVSVNDVDMDINDTNLIDDIFADAGKKDSTGNDSGKN